MKFLFTIVFGFSLMVNADEHNHNLPDISTNSLTMSYANYCSCEFF